MGKNVIITESALKSLISEEIANFSVINKVLDLMNKVPDKFILEKSIMRKGRVRYLWWVLGEYEHGVLKKYDGLPQGEDVARYLEDIGFDFDGRQRDGDEEYTCLRYKYGSIRIELGYGTDFVSKSLLKDLSPESVIKDRTGDCKLKFVDMWLQMPEGLV